MEVQFPNINIHNKYIIQVIEKETKKIIQEAYAFNKANSSRYTYWSSIYSSGTSLSTLYLGTGTQTESSVSLEKPWTSVTITWEEIDNAPSFVNKAYQSIATFSTSLGAVDLTEIGIYSGSRCFSYANLVDVEGNPIVVSKKETQELRVTTTIYFSTIFPKLEDIKYNFKFYPSNFSSLGGVFEEKSSRNLPGSNVSEIILSSLFSPSEDSNDSRFTLWANTPNGSSFSLTKKTDEEVFPISYEGNAKFDLNSNNIGYIHSMIIPGLGVISFPNLEICPKYKYAGYTIGTGNGEAKTWWPRLDEIIIEESSFYLNEKTQTLGQYNFETQQVENGEVAFVNFDITKSPLWNKCVRVDYSIYHRNSSPTTLETSLSPNVNLKSGEINPGAPIALTNFYCCGDVPEDDTNFSFRSAGCNYCPGGYTGYQSISKSNTSPVYYDENGLTVDHILRGRAYGTAGGGYNYDICPSYEIQISEDGESWTTIFTSTKAFQAEYFLKEDGTKYISKWWRLRESSSPYSMVRTYSHPEYSEMEKVGIDLKYIALGNSSEYDFGKVGLNFATPPADGDVITMDATLDLPYKDNEIISYHSAKVIIPDPESLTEGGTT